MGNSVTVANRNHWRVVPEIIATGLMCPAHNHCTWTHKDCNWDRNRRRRAHADCTGRRAGMGIQTTGLLPIDGKALRGGLSPATGQGTGLDFQSSDSLSRDGFSDRQNLHQIGHTVST